MRLLSSVFLSLICVAAFAQAPTWSVNPNSFQYNMTVTAVLDVNCSELTNPSNQLAAFSNGVLRGVANTSNVVGGRYIATMSVYSNQVSGENITFQFYDNVADSVYTSIDSVIFQDNALYGTPNIPLDLKINNAPTQINLSNDSILENQPTGQVVGDFTTTDQNMMQSHSYTLVSGTGSINNGLFSISGNQLLANFVADFETKTSYSVRVRTTDSEGCFFESDFSVYIQNVNDAPTALAISANQFDENNLMNANLATISATDSDVNEQFTYSLVSGSGGADNAAFSIAGSSLRAATVFDFETQDEYSIRLQVSDRAANTFIDTFKILINNLNEAPTDIVLTSDSILENMPINSVVATLSTTDQDAGQSFSYSFSNVSGNDNASFNLVGNSLRTAASFDFEPRGLYFIYIQTDDLNGGTYTEQISIRVINANDDPTDIQLSSSNVAENLPVGSFVGRIISTDQDAGATFSYSLISGVGNANNGNFQVSNDSLLTNTIFNVNTQPSQNIRLQVTDNGMGTFQKAFTIVISDVNNAPSALFLSNNNVPESTTLGSIIGNFTSADPDANDVHSYTLVSGTGDADNGNFLITGLDLKTDTVFDINLKSQYNIRVRTTDLQGSFFEDALVINIINSNDAPTNISIASSTVNENAVSNSLVGLLSTTDPDIGDGHTYTFANLSANDNASFVLVSNELRTSAVFDFETKAVYFVQIQTTDISGGSFSKQLTITVNDTNDTPTGLALSANNANEKQTMNQFVAKLNTTDQDAIDSFSYSLVAGTGNDDNADFLISNDSLFATGNFDVLVKSILSIRLRTTDATNTFFEKAFTINVQDVNDAPTDISIDNISIPENTALNAIVGNFSSSDIDLMQTFTYQLASGTGDSDNANFIISSNQLRSNILFDFNVQKLHSVRIRTTDQGGLSMEKAFTIQITNSNDAPTDIALTPNNFKENLPQSSLIGEFSTVDKDSTDAFSYSFVNQGTNDNSAFIIAGKELRTGSNFDFETKNLYVIEVQTRDNSGVTFSRQLTLTVTDSNDAPTALTISADSLQEKSVERTFVADLITVDEDATDNFTYSFVAGQGSTDNALFRINGSILESDSVLDFNDAKVRNIRIQSTDKGGRTIQSAFAIRIVNENDAPTALTLSNLLVQENNTIGSRVGSLTTTDSDVNDTFTYQLVNGVGDVDNVSFTINGNEVLTAATFDFEAAVNYVIRIRTTDASGASFEAAIGITISNENEAPEIDRQSFSVQENAAVGTNVGILALSDVDGPDVLTVRLITGNDLLSIDQNTFEIATNVAFDYEIQPQVVVLAEVTDAAGLKDTAEVLINVMDAIEGNLPAAGYFSPNGDGMNDTWSISNVDLYSDYKLNIFSSNGQLVFEKAANYTNDWDGTVNGSQLPEGVYYYFLEKNLSSDQTFKGTITLKR